MKENDKYLFLTIPYDEDWRIIVDGTPVKAMQTLDTLTVLKLDSGTHSVQLIYTNSKLILGLFISLAGIIIFSIIIFIDKNHKKHLTYSNK